MLIRKVPYDFDEIMLEFSSRELEIRHVVDEIHKDFRANVKAGEVALIAVKATLRVTPFKQRLCAVQTAVGVVYSLQIPRSAI